MTDYNLDVRSERVQDEIRRVIADLKNELSASKTHARRLEAERDVAQGTKNALEMMLGETHGLLLDLEQAMARVDLGNLGVHGDTITAIMANVRQWLSDHPNPTRLAAKNNEPDPLQKIARDLNDELNAVRSAVMVLVGIVGLSSDVTKNGTSAVLGEVIPVVRRAMAEAGEVGRWRETMQKERFEHGELTDAYHAQTKLLDTIDTRLREVADTIGLDRLVSDVQDTVTVINAIEVLFKRQTANPTPRESQLMAEHRVYYDAAYHAANNMGWVQPEDREAVGLLELISILEAYANLHTSPMKMEMDAVRTELQAIYKTLDLDPYPFSPPHIVLQRIHATIRTTLQKLAEADVALDEALSQLTDPYYYFAPTGELQWIGPFATFEAAVTDLYQQHPDLMGRTPTGAFEWKEAKWTRQGNPRWEAAALNRKRKAHPLMLCIERRHVQP